MDKKRTALGLCIAAFIIQAIWILKSLAAFSKATPEVRECTPLSEPIDAVYTWVNGSDVDFLASLAQYKPDDENGYTYKGADPARFEDFEQLEFSLRSLEYYAPWVRHVYIVTNGQVPVWLNESSEYITVVSHRDIYPVKSHLPTFSSPSIETHLHRIEGLSERFLYFNDDISLLAPICPEDYFRDEDEIIYFNPAYPSGQFIYELECPSNCSALGSNNACDMGCNLLACLYDNDECDQIDNPDEPFSGEAFYKSIDYTNLLFNARFNVDQRKRRWLSHMPFMIRKSIVFDLQSIFAREYNITSAHRLRAKNDVQFAFAYYHFLVESDSYSTVTKEAENYGSYIFVDDHYDEVKRKLRQVYQPSFLFPYRHAKLWLCVNDGMNPNHPDNLKIKALLHEWYSQLYPIKSQFENGAYLVDGVSPVSWETLYDNRPLRSNIRIGDLFNDYDANMSSIDEKSWLVILLVKNFVFFVLMPLGFTRLYETLHGRRSHRIIYKSVPQAKE